MSAIKQNGWGRPGDMLLKRSVPTSFGQLVKGKGILTDLIVSEIGSSCKKEALTPIWTQAPCRKVSNPDWLVNIFTMVVCENYFSI